MKIIDLLNKIANGEEVPKQIKYCGVDYYWTNSTYENPEAEETLFWFDVYSEENLNDEVEIIEEDKKIEKIDLIDDYTPYIQFRVTANKINEIIDYLNKRSGE